MKIESFVADEYLTVLHAELVELMVEEIDLDQFKVILEMTGKDEKGTNKPLG